MKADGIRIASNTTKKVTKMAKRQTTTFKFRRKISYNAYKIGFACRLAREYALLFTCTFSSLMILCTLMGAMANRQVAVAGDILLGGLFPIHAGRSTATQCGRMKADQGVQRMVAMLYALDSINRDEQILPGIRLGAQILDTCSVETHALEQSLEFIKTVMTTSALATCADGTSSAQGRLSRSRNQPVAAVIGAASSQVSVMVASMLQLFKIPMLSYSSTGVELSEKPRFAYFSRVVPPDNLQAKAMAHLVAKLEWNYVHAIADTGSYGERGMDSFRAAATERGICIDGDMHKISRRWTDDEFEELLLRMRHSNKARGVVMFVDEDNLRRFLTILKRLITSGRHPQLQNYFWFVASDSWGMKTSVIKGFEQIANGAITIAPKVRFLRGFNEYFRALGPVNTFLSEYWQSMNCSNRINENFGKCFESLGAIFKQEAYVPFVFDAVKLVAKALHNYIMEICGDLHKLRWNECYLSRVGFDGFKLQSLYRNVSLNANEPPLIDSNGDGIGQYNIFQLNKSGIYSHVGRWLAGNELQLNLNEVRKGLSDVDGSNAFPVSVCSWPCRHGFYRAYQDQTCCWTCIPCDITTSIIVNETSCIQCKLGYVPNANLSSCKRIEPVYMQWSSAWALLPAVFAFCGIIATTIVVVIFVKNNDTPVVMASSRELCYCMLVGIALCYLMTFILLWRPNTYSCALSRVFIGVSMAAIYAAILVKTNRVERLFKPSSAIRPRFISPSSQVAICFLIVSVQFVGSSVWLIVDPPGTTIQYPTRVEAVLTCKATATPFLLSLLFNMLLILACTIYAFKTRKIPENFNETRLIGFTMYSTCILWLAFGPIYFAIQNNFRIQITSLCVCISMSGTVALACIFAPKVYIVLWQPYKNVRTRNSAVGKLVNQQMRFISQISSNSAQSIPSGVLTSATALSPVTRKNTTVTIRNAHASFDSAYVTVTGTGSPQNCGTAPSSTATHDDEDNCNNKPLTSGTTTTTQNHVEVNTEATAPTCDSVVRSPHQSRLQSHEPEETDLHVHSNGTLCRQLLPARRSLTSERNELALSRRSVPSTFAVLDDSRAKTNLAGSTPSLLTRPHRQIAIEEEMTPKTTNNYFVVSVENKKEIRGKILDEIDEIREDSNESDTDDNSYDPKKNHDPREGGNDALRFASYNCTTTIMQDGRLSLTVSDMRNTVKEQVDSCSSTSSSVAISSAGSGSSTASLIVDIDADEFSPYEEHSINKKLMPRHKKKKTKCEENNKHLSNFAINPNCDNNDSDIVKSETFPCKSNSAIQLILRDINDVVTFL